MAPMDIFSPHLQATTGRKTIYCIGPLVEMDDKKEYDGEKTEEKEPPEPSVKEKIDAIQKRTPKKLEDPS